MGIREIDDDLIDFAVNKYIEGMTLISLEKETTGYIVVTRELPVVN